MGHFPLVYTPTLVFFPFMGRWVFFGVLPFANSTLPLFLVGGPFVTLSMIVPPSSFHWGLLTLGVEGLSCPFFCWGPKNKMGYLYFLRITLPGTCNFQTLNHKVFTKRFAFLNFLYKLHSLVGVTCISPFHYHISKPLWGFIFSPNMEIILFCRV